MSISNVLIIISGLLLPLVIEKLRGKSKGDYFKLRDLSKVLAILLIYYGISTLYYKVIPIERVSLYFFIGIKIALTIAFILAILTFSPLANAVTRLTSFPRIERGSSFYFTILCFFLYTSFTVFLAVDIFPEKVELQLRNIIILKAINENPFIAILPLIMVEIFAVIGEEIVFRYFAINALRQKLKKIWAIIISSLIWTLMHGEVNFGLFVLGLVLSYLFYETESLTLCVVLHFIFNFVVLTEPLYLFYKDTGAIAISSFQYIVILFVLQILLFYSAQMVLLESNKNISRNS